MAQFDVHPLTDEAGGGLVVDCQSDLLDHIGSRFVVPLIPRADAPPPARGLNPVFTIESEDSVMLTQSASAVRRRHLGAPVRSLEDRRLEIVSALDMLISGV